MYTQEQFDNEMWQLFDTVSSDEFWDAYFKKKKLIGTLDWEDIKGTGMIDINKIDFTKVDIDQFITDNELDLRFETKNIEDKTVVAYLCFCEMGDMYNSEELENFANRILNDGRFARKVYEGYSWFRNAMGDGEHSKWLFYINAYEGNTEYVDNMINYCNVLKNTDIAQTIYDCPFISKEQKEKVEYLVIMGKIKS